MPGRLTPVRLRTYRAYSHEQAINAAREDLGQDVRVIQTHHVRRGGLLGFWSRPIIELTVELVTPPQEPGPDATQVEASRAYAASVTPAESEPAAELDMEFERAKTRRLAQALAAKLEKDGRIRSGTERNERLVEQTAHLQRSIDERAVGRREQPRVAQAPPATVAERFVLVPDATQARHMQERQALLGGEGDPLEELVSTPQSTPQPDLMRRAVTRAVAEERTGIGVFGAGDTGNPDLLRAIYVRLIEQEVTEEIAEQLVAEITEEVGFSGLQDPGLLQRTAERRIASMMPVDEHPLDITEARRSARPYVVALIGPTGVGKTTTIAKLAAASRFRDGLSVGLVTTDSFRMAAVEQLRSYADILKVPLEVVIEPEDMADALKRLHEKDVILIDSAGRSRRDEERLEQLQAFLQAARPDETHLVLSTTSGERTMLRDADAFANLGADRVVLTKLDETDGFGVLVNVIRKLGTRISFVTTGQEVPDDIERGGADRIARMLLAGVLPSEMGTVGESESCQ